MKILVISNLYPPHEIGGYEIRCRDIMEGLRARGHEVRILTSDHQVPGRVAEGQEHVTRRLKVHGMYGHSWLPIQKLYSQEKYNHQVLQDEIDAFKPDLIHVWNMGGISKSLLHRLEAGSIPVVYDISDHWIARSLRADVWLGFWNEPEHAVGNLAVKLFTASGIRSALDRHADTTSPKKLKLQNIYFCSAFLRDQTASKGWPVAHAKVIHCGIDATAFTVKTSHESFSKLLWVGRMNDDKDPFTAIRALKAARDRGLDLTLDLYGGGAPEDFARVDAEIAALGLEGLVQRRTVPAAAMRDLYAKYDALLFTSNWGEPFALTPLEAGASGLPVISSLDGGQAELVRDGENMLAAKAGDPASYADALERLAKDQALREGMAATALVETQRRFDLPVIIGEIEDFLTKCLKAG
ncbi:MAG: glycosyltransferase family 1 protein [Akkermansiaceae bacterium]|nr:glycosyltransferase family 1 protein [Akkermansiaceae bacterium]